MTSSSAPDIASTLASSVAATVQQVNSIVFPTSVTASMSQAANHISSQVRKMQENTLMVSNDLNGNKKIRCISSGRSKIYSVVTNYYFLIKKANLMGVGTTTLPYEAMRREVTVTTNIAPPNPGNQENSLILGNSLSPTIVDEEVRLNKSVKIHFTCSLSIFRINSTF